MLKVGALFSVIFLRSFCRKCYTYIHTDYLSRARMSTSSEGDTLCTAGKVDGLCLEQSTQQKPSVFKWVGRKHLFLFAQTGYETVAPLHLFWRTLYAPRTPRWLFVTCLLRPGVSSNART